MTPPETLISPAKRVMALTDPTKKMSKSNVNPKSKILLTDSEAEIRNKLKTAVTDSFEGITYEPERRPGVSNLIDLLYHSDEAAGSDSQEALAKDLGNISLRVLKDWVAEAVEKQVRPVRERYAEVISDRELLDQAAHQGAQQATKSAEGTLTKVKRAIGFV